MRVARGHQEHRLDFQSEQKWVVVVPLAVMGKLSRKGV